MSKIKEIKSARKRAFSMGVESDYLTEYERHFLAACIDNHARCIDEELKMPLGENDRSTLRKSEEYRCYRSILEWIYIMANRINEFCDNNKVKGDKAAEYWLWKFSQYVDIVCRVDLLNEH